MSALILLAAGRSRRFGASDKLMVDWGGVPLAVHTAEAVSAGWTGARIAVVSSSEVGKSLRAAGWTCVTNPAPEAGQSSSLVLGVEAAGRRDVVVVLADMPNVSAKHIHEIDNAVKRCGTAISTFDGRLMPPAGFAAAHHEELLALEGDQGARTVFERHPGAELPLDARAMHDIDTPDDLFRGTAA